VNASGISAGTAANAAVIREHSAAARVSVLVPDGFRREISLDVAVAPLVGRAVALRNLALGRRRRVLAVPHSRRPLREERLRGLAHGLREELRDGEYAEHDLMRGDGDDAQARRARGDAGHRRHQDDASERHRPRRQERRVRLEPA
jgi:hypothetical protein